MLRVKVAVYLADESALLSCPHHVLSLFEEKAREGDKPREEPFIDGNAAVRLYLVEVLFRVRTDRLDPAVGTAAVDRRLGVETRQHLTHFGKWTAQQSPLSYEVRKQPTFRYPLHLHRVLGDRGTFRPPESIRVSLHVYGDNAEVGIAGQTRVEEHLLFAVEAPFGEGREVEETEVHGLLDLVDHLTRDEHVGDVRLVMGDGRRLFRVALRLQQEFDEVPVGPHGHLISRCLLNRA